MIGVFDSGVGGLTVVRELKKSLPGEKIIYVGDTARVPWGNKSAETVQKYSAQICDFLVSKKISTVVIACNTASATSGDFLRKKFRQVKFFDVVEPAVKKISLNKFSKIAVIGTRATINSGIYQKSIKSKNKKAAVFSKECPLFVPLVEEGWTKGRVPEAVAKEYFKIFSKKNVEALVLGCTHYPLLIPTIKRAIGERVEIVNCATEVAKVMQEGSDKRSLDKKTKGGNDEFYFTDASQYYLDLTEEILEKKITIKNFPQKYL